MRSLEDDPSFDLASTFRTLRAAEKGFSSEPLSVPYDLYTSEGEESLTAEAEDPLLPARILMGIGNAYLAQPQPEPAAVNYREALAVAGLEADPRLTAMILTNLGFAQRASGLAEEARASFERALTEFGRTEEPLLERRAHSGLAALALARGDLDGAEVSYRLALDLHRRADDEQGEARALAGLGRVHAARDRHDEARRAFAEALDLAERLDDRDTRLHAEVGLGAALFESGRLQEAGRHLEAARELVDEHQAELRTDEGKVAYLERMDDLFDLLLRIYLRRAQRDPTGWAVALAVSEEARGRATAQIVGLRRRVPLPDHRRKAPQPVSGVISFADADQSARAAAVGEPAPEAWSGPDPSQHAAGADLPDSPFPLLEPPEPTPEKPTDEELDPLAGPQQTTAGAELPGDWVPGPDSSAELEDDSDPNQGSGEAGWPLDEIPGLEEVIGGPAPGVGPGGPDPSQTARAADASPELPGEIGRARRRSSGQQDQDAFHVPSPAWDGPSRRPVVPLPRLSFHVLEESTAIFTVTREGEVHGHLAPLGRQELAAKVRELRDTLGIDSALRGVRCEAERVERPTPNAGRREELLAFLYALLVAPVADLLPATNTPLAILPHGPLWLLPFAALQDENGGWLGDRWQLVFAVSGETLDELRAEKPWSEAEGLRMLGGGDPLIAPPLKPGGAGEFCFAQLSHAATEARSIVELAAAGAGAEPPTLLLGAEADSWSLRRALTQHDVVHLATHGVASDSDPLDSFLVVAPGSDSGSPGSGRLTARQVSRELAVPADLVVLSACQTGMGRLSGEGVLGLGRSFLVAGARSVIVSLWSVHDQATSYLMNVFYREYLAGATKAAALQTAMRKTRQRRKWESPSYWAPFILMGAED